MRQLLIGMSGLAILITAGCAVSLQTAVPKELFHQSVACPTNHNTKAADLQVLSTHKWSKGLVVLYSALCPSKSHPAVMQRVFAHTVVKRTGMNWQISGSDSFGIQDKQLPAEQLVDYDISQSAGQGRDRYTILYGQFLASKVSAVEATFDNGKVIRARGNNGMFALISPGATAVCELRILGADNQILRQDDLTTPKRLVKLTHKHRCLPVTHQL